MAAAFYRHGFHLTTRSWVWPFLAGLFKCQARLFRQTTIASHYHNRCLALSNIIYQRPFPSALPLYNGVCAGAILAACQGAARPFRATPRSRCRALGEDVFSYGARISANLCPAGTNPSAGMCIRAVGRLGLNSRPPKAY